MSVGTVRIGGACLALLLLTACDPVSTVVVGGGAMAVNAAAERRTAGDYLDDNWVAWHIRAAFARSEVVRAGNVNVSVYQGRVLLTGTAASQKEIDEAVRLTKQTRGVRKVDVELKVQYEDAAELANDVLISNKVKLEILTSRQVRGVDIHVETTKGVVFLTGLTQSVRERDEAVRLASRVGGVKEVVSYLEVNPQTTPVINQPEPASEPIRRPGVAAGK